MNGLEWFIQYESYQLNLGPIISNHLWWESYEIILVCFISYIQYLYNKHSIFCTVRYIGGFTVRILWVCLRLHMLQVFYVIVSQRYRWNYWCVNSKDQIESFSQAPKKKISMVAVRYNAESDEISMSNSHLQNDLAERSFCCLRIKTCWFALPKRKLIGMIIHDESCSRAGLLGTSTSSPSWISKIHLTVLRLLFIPDVCSPTWTTSTKAIDEN